ncbi:MAG TPA: peptidylprolyl isomerase [Nocardioides sp.]|nr:peptidylprolyl isomerase [Nocardioides sp.]
MADLQATLKTNKGDITINLFPNHAPRTVASFVGLAKGEPVEVSPEGPYYPSPREGSVGDGPFYDGLGFHRVIAGFMIQGGCPQGTGTGGPGYNFDDEPHPELTFDRPYLLAMANAGVQGGRGTNGSQFFITVGATSWLNFKHTIFGEVADQAGRDVVDAIAATPTGPGDRPVEPVVIEHVEISGE